MTHPTVDLQNHPTRAIEFGLLLRPNSMRRAGAKRRFATRPINLRNHQNTIEQAIRETAIEDA